MYWEAVWCVFHVCSTLQTFILCYLICCVVQWTRTQRVWGDWREFLLWQVDTGRCKPANISTALLGTNIPSLLLHNSRNVWNSVINFTLKSCWTWVKKLDKVVVIFNGFIKTVELCSETVEILWAIYTLPTTSDVKNSQQTTLHFLFR